MKNTKVTKVTRKDTKTTNTARKITNKTVKTKNTDNVFTSAQRTYLNRSINMIGTDRLNIKDLTTRFNTRFGTKMSVYQISGYFGAVRTNTNKH